MSAADRIDAGDLVPMDVFAQAGEALEIDLVYADAQHPENIFGIAAYRPGARLSLHKDLAAIVIEAARNLHRSQGWTLILKDGLRPVEAQRALIGTDIVKANPHWLEEPRMLSSPGQGAHPRGMAIDVSVRGSDGSPVDMGTAFDEMTPRSARLFDGLPAGIGLHRSILENAFLAAGEKFGIPILPLPSEWWDFRFPHSQSGRFAPLSEADLPCTLRMSADAADDAGWDERHAALAKAILQSL